MAVLEMKKINICALKKDRKAILEYLQKQGCVEIVNEIEPDETFGQMNTATQISIFDRNTALVENALEVLGVYAPEKKSMLSSLEGKKDVDNSDYQSVIDRQSEMLDIARDLNLKSKRIDELNSAIARCNEDITALSPWEECDLPLNFRGTEKTAFMPGLITGTYTREDLEQKLLNIEGLPEEFEAQIISADKYHTYICCVFMRDQQDEVEQALRQLDFSRPPVLGHHVPKQSIANRKAGIEEHNKEIEEIKKEILDISSNRRDLEILGDYFRMRSQKYEVLGGLAQSRHVFFISGYIPEKKLSCLSVLKEKYTISIRKEKFKKKEDKPVLLENGSLSEPVEGVVTSFGFPNKTEIDPTAITSFFYYFLFGIMLSDAAYGLLMFFGCQWALKKFPNMSKSMSKSLRMFRNCGVSTFFWGVLFGGFFGDAVSVIGSTFFGVDIAIPALWFQPIEEPMQMLVYCLLFGIIHLFVGLGIKGYMMLKQGDVVGFVSDIVMWYLFLIGLLMMLIPSSMFASLLGTSITFPAWANMLAKVLAVVGMLGILIMAGRRSVSPVKRLLLGLYSLYDITSWLSDLLSYSRLLALGLATGVIAQVINTMAAMGGRSFVGVIMFIVIFLIGHTFNMAVNLLGAYVHTNRLQYVEFFGKFYEGGGREFVPFKEDTRYITVKDMNSAK